MSKEVKNGLDNSISIETLHKVFYYQTSNNCDYIWPMPWKSTYFDELHNVIAVFKVKGVDTSKPVNLPF